MAIGDIYQLNIIQRLQTQTIENVLHYEVTADADRSVLEAALHLFASSNFADIAKLVQSSDLTYQLSRAQKIWPLPAAIASEVIMTQNGDIGDQALPAEVAAVITKQSFLAGRKYRGRLYFAGLMVANVVQITGLFTDPTIASLNTLGLAMSAPIYGTPSGSLVPIIYHRGDHTATLITTCVGRPTPRVQRRRQIGRGI